MKTLIITLTLVLIGLAGCTALYDLWPAQTPKDTMAYVNIEPNEIKWQSIGKLKEIREECITKNIVTQAMFLSRMQIDKLLYARAIDQANINITSAENERNQIVGTINNPGWLLSLLLPIGGGFLGRAVTQLTHYSESELQSKIAETATQPKA